MDDIQKIALEKFTQVVDFAKARVQELNSPPTNQIQQFQMKMDEAAFWLGQSYMAKPKEENHATNRNDRRSKLKQARESAKVRR